MGNAAAQSILKRFHTEIWGRFIRAVNEYKLISNGDKIAVCISGGKDSLCLALCMQELQRQSRLAKRQDFEIVYLCMNPGYSPETLKKVKSTAKTLGIPLTLFKSDIFKVVSKAGGSPCYLCAKMRRGALYAHAKELGCNKIALAHHMEDTVETVMMNLLYNGRVQTMMPKLRSANFAGMQLIRPLCLVREPDIIKWRDNTIKNMGAEFIHCACPLGDKAGKRLEVKTLLAGIAKDNPVAPINIYNAMNNINLDTVLGYSKDDEHVSFLDNFGE